MTKTYTYTVSVDFDFDDLRERFHLHSKSPFSVIRDAVHEYSTEMEDAEYYCVNNEAEIALDLQEYLQNYDVATAIGVDKKELQKIFAKLWRKCGDEYTEDDEDYCRECIRWEDAFCDFDFDDEAIENYLTKQLVKYFNSKLKHS